MRSLIFATCILVVGCASPDLATTSDDPMTTSASALQQGEMIVYRIGDHVPATELVDLGPPAGLGGAVLEGDPKIAARVDYTGNGITAGVFQATRGKILIHFPFTEHATILNGQVTLTDEAGSTHTFKPGDSYLIKQGSNIVWDVNGASVQKSFFNRVLAADEPGPMIVYPLGSAASDSDLVDLGPPSGLGGTVLDGDPTIAARVDYANGGLLGGVFQATRGNIRIDFPFTEHATFLRGGVTLSDENGQTHHFNPGDSYLIAQGSQIGWDVDGASVQKSFFNFTQP